MEASKQIRVGAILSYISIGLNILVGFLCTPLIIKHLGESGYGIYTLAFSVINTFLLDFGLSSATSRYIAKYRSENNQEAINNIYGLIVKLYIIISIILMVFFSMWISKSADIYHGLTASEITTFNISFVIAGLYSLISFPFTTIDGVLTAYEKFIQAKTINIINRVVMTILILLCIFLKLNIYYLIGAHAVAGAISIAVKCFFVHKYTPARPNFKYKSSGAVNEIISFSLWVTVSTLASRLIFNIVPTILGAFSTSSEIAIFGLVTTIESYVYTFATAISGMFLPKITRIYHESDPEKNIEPLLIKVGKYQFILNGLIICGFAVLGQQFLNWWVGDGYSTSYFGILAVVIPNIFFISLQIANTALIVTKKVKIQAIVNLISGISNLIMCIPMSMFFGAIGASISICVSVLIKSIAFNYVSIKYLKLPMKNFYINVYLKLSIPIITISGLGLLFTHFVSVQKVYVWILVGVVITLSYSLMSFFFAFNKAERNNLFYKVKGFFKHE